MWYSTNTDIDFMPKAMDFYPSQNIWVKVWAENMEESFLTPLKSQEQVPVN